MVAMFLAVVAVVAQVESHPVPIQRRGGDAMRAALREQLPSRNFAMPGLPAAKRLQPLSAEEQTRKPSKLATTAGVHRNVAGLDGYARWDAIDGGARRVWRLVIESPGAAGIRVHLRNFDAGSTGRLYVHDGEPNGEVHGPYVGRGLFDDGDFWTDAVLTDRVVLEFESATQGSIPFEIAGISHLLPGILQAAGKADAAATCHLDVTCYSEWNDTAKSVGHIVYEEDGATYVCSGTLLATRNRSGIPYFLTADHCIDRDATARTMQVFWFYQSSVCNGAPADRRNVPRSNGAKYLVSAGVSRGDFSLVQLLTVPDTVTFSGWDTNEIGFGTAVTGIHHPAGDYKRISFGERAVQQTVGFPGANMATFYNINFTRGATEGGSSGSGIFSRPGVLVGTLTWGPKVDTPNGICQYQPLPTGYGRFSSHYTSIRDYLEDRTAGTTQPPPVTTGQGTELISGQARSVSLENVASATLFTGARGYYVRVPQGATRVEFTLRASGDVGLIVRADQSPAITDGRVVSDYTSSGTTGQETIVITPQSTPALRTGITYYVALADFSTNRAITGTLTATVTTASAGTGGGVLTSGVPATFNFAAVQNNTLVAGTLGYRVTVPQGATRLEVKLKTNPANADLDLYVRFGQDISLEGTRVVADYRSEGAAGDETVVISTPALQSGTYYIGFGIFTANVATNGTVTATVTGGAAGGAETTVLTPGTARAFTVAPVVTPTLLNGARGFAVQVPTGASRLDIRLTTATAGADLDLLVRYGADPTTTSGKLEADFNSSGPDGNELISITPQSNPPLRAGTYYIALAVFTKNVTINGSLLATVSTGSAPPTGGGGGNLITPGSSVAFAIPAVSSATLRSGAQGYRVEVPAGATRLEVQLNVLEPDADVDLYLRKDVEPAVQNGKVVADFSSTGPRGVESIVVDLSSKPPLSAGVYYIALGIFTPGQPVSGTVRVTLGSATAPPASTGTPLRSGVATNFSLPSVTAATLVRADRGYYIDVPAGAQKLDVKLNTTTAGVDLDLYVRFGQDIGLDNRQPVADFSSEGSAGNESVTVEGASLRAGRYFIGLGVFTTGVAIKGILTATVTLPGAAAPASSRDLAPGIPAKVSMPSRSAATLFTGTYGYKLTVPAGVTRVRLDLRTDTPNADVDLYARFGEDVDLDDNGIVADFFSEGDTGRESIVIDASTSPTLQPGVYYIAFGNYATGTAVESTITATFERESIVPPLSSATLLQPGQPARFQLPAVTSGTLFQGDYAYRVVVPERTARLEINLRADDESSDVDLMVRRGQEAQVVEGRVVADYNSTNDTGVEQIVLDNPAAGVYFLNLALFTPGRNVSGTISATLTAAQRAPLLDKPLLEVDAIADKPVRSGVGRGVAIDKPAGSLLRRSLKKTRPLKLADPDIAETHLGVRRVLESAVILQ